MNAKQENRFSMAKSVLKTLDDHNTVVTSLTALANAKTELTTLVAEIDSLTQVQSLKTSAKEKTDAEKVATTLALEVIAAAKAYALDNNKPAIAASFNYTKRKLEKMRDTVLVNTLKLIKDNANLLTADLAGYGADATKLTQLQTATSAYEVLLTRPKSNIAARSTATKAMSIAFEKLQDMMQVMDNIVETKRNSHTDFYNSYKVMRKVENRHGGKGKGKDDEKGDAPTEPQK